VLIFRDELEKNNTAFLGKKMNSQGWKIVITDCDHGSVEIEREEFGRIGAELILAQVKREEDLIQACRGADGLMNQYAMLTRRVLEALRIVKS